MEHSDVLPETVALDALIRETLTRTRGRGSASSADALLFLGNRHEAYPALVVRDPILEPVDKLVWMVIHQSAGGAGTKGLFPSYSDIARLANVSSTSTVSRAIAILRATRWLSLCARSRDECGRFGGNVYALHDEPLPLVDALHLDPGYMQFLGDATRHHHARVRRVVAAISESLDEDIRVGTDVLAPVNPIERRIEAVHAIHQRGTHRYFSFSAAKLSSLSNAGADRHARGQHQNSKAVGRDPQNSKSVLRSSSKYIKTTTTTNTQQDFRAREAAALQNLIVPARLKDNQRSLAARYLSQIPEDQRQMVLDELEGRLQNERYGAKPIYDELRYLHRLCTAVNRGGFHPNLALKVQAERERRRRDEERQREEAAARKREREARAARPKGPNPIEEIRKKLGMPPARRRRPR